MNRLTLLLFLFVPCSWAVCALNHYAVRELVNQTEESHAYLGENLERIKRLNYAQTYAHTSMEIVEILARENARVVEENEKLTQQYEYLLFNYDWLVSLLNELLPVAEQMRDTLIENGLEVPDSWSTQPQPVEPGSD